MGASSRRDRLHDFGDGEHERLRQHAEKVEPAVTREHGADAVAHLAGAAFGNRTVVVARLEVADDGGRRHDHPCTRNLGAP